MYSYVVKLCVIATTALVMMTICVIAISKLLWVGHISWYSLYIHFRGADIYAKDVSGFTPMMNAIAYGHKEVIKVFFDFDYSVDTVVKRGKMLLEWAIEFGHHCMIEVFCFVS